MRQRVHGWEEKGRSGGPWVEVVGGLRKEGKTSEVHTCGGPSMKSDESEV